MLPKFSPVVDEPKPSTGSVFLFYSRTLPVFLHTFFIILLISLFIYLCIYSLFIINLIFIFFLILINIVG